MPRVRELRDELKSRGVPAERVNACLEKDELERLLQETGWPAQAACAAQTPSQTRPDGQWKGKAAVKWFDFATSKNLSSVGDQTFGRLGGACTGREYYDDNFMLLHGKTGVNQTFHATMCVLRKGASASED